MRILLLLKYLTCNLGSIFSIFAIIASLSLTPRTLGSSSLHTLGSSSLHSLGSSLLHPRPLSPEGRRSLREYCPSGLRRTKEDFRYATCCYNLLFLCPLIPPVFASPCNLLTTSSPQHTHHLITLSSCHLVTPSLCHLSSHISSYVLSLSTKSTLLPYHSIALFSS